MLGRMRQRADIAANPVSRAPPSVGGGAAVQNTPQWRRPPPDRYLRVRVLLLASSLVLTFAAGTALARDPAPSVPSPATAAPAQSGGARFSPAANEAVQVVNDFMTALVAGKLESARLLMTPDAVVIANGQVLGDRDDYINGAAKGDAAALGTVQRELLRRDAKAGPNLAWVLSEKRLRAPGTTQGPSEVVVETMLLAKTAAGWKISHIHWSGRTAGRPASQPAS